LEWWKKLKEGTLITTDYGKIYMVIMQATHDGKFMGKRLLILNGMSRGQVLLTSYSAQEHLSTVVGRVNGIQQDPG